MIPRLGQIPSEVAYPIVETVPYFTLLPSLVATVKDAISVIPASFAQTYAKLMPIRMFRPPINLPEHNLIMVWARNQDKDPALCWLRETIRVTAQGVVVAPD